MKLPVPIGGAIATALTGGIALAGELDLSHPLKQAVTIAGALAIAIVGYYTVPSSSSAPASTAPPFNIPDPLPTPAPAAAAPAGRAVIDQAAQDAASRSLP